MTTESAQSNVELLAQVAVEARTRAVGWLVVIAAFAGFYALGTAVLMAGNAGAMTIVSAIGLLVGMSAFIAVVASLIPLARSAWTYRAAKAALLAEVNS